MGLVDDFEFSKQIILDGLKTLSNVGLISGVDEQANELKLIVRTFEEARTKIDADPERTGIGKQNAVHEERGKGETAARAWLTGLHGGIDAQDAAVDATRRAKADQATRKPSDAQVTGMVTMLRSHDGAEIASLYANATDDERVTMELAIAQIGRMPRRRPDGQVEWTTLLPSSRIAEVRAARLETADPEAATLLSDLNRTRNAYTALASTAIELLQ